MTQRKSIGAKLFIALIALTLISCCFLGSTFARYTSGGNGSASTGVAEWNIAGSFEAGTADSDSITVHFDGLTPSKAGYQEGTNRTNSTGKILIATIANNGEVDAEITLTVSKEASFVSSGNGAVTFDPTGYTLSGGSLSGSGASKDQVKGLFSITLYQDDSNTYADGGKIESTIDLAAESGAVYIFAEITWTSADAKGEAVADAIDTWVGKNVFGVAYDISYVAVQAEQSVAK